MKPLLKWSLIFGCGGALLNIVISLITSLFGLIFSPIATGIAVFVALNDEQFEHQDASWLGIKMGLIVGGIGSIGILVGEVAYPLVLSLVQSMARGSFDFSSLSGAMLTMGASAFFLIAFALIISILSTGISVVVGVIVCKVITSRKPSQKLQVDIETPSGGSPTVLVRQVRPPYRNFLTALAITSLLIVCCNVATTFPYLEQIDTRGVFIIVAINLGAYFVMLGSISAAWLLWRQGRIRLVYPIGLLTLIPIIACFIGDLVMIVSRMNPACGCGG
ncbi:MAG TPA: hypothetical protein VLX61_11530 [Anaerolineales bacterium]|nr:hypothetical protein [Anaerolineales bacterium]